MQHPTRTVLTGLALATSLVGFTACGSNGSSSPSASTSVSTSTSPAPSSPDSSSTPGASDSGSPAASDSASMSGMPAARTLFQDARASALKATSAHVYGTVIEQGTKTGFDLNGRTDATNLIETYTKGSKGRLTLLTVGGKYWLRGDRAGLTQFTNASTAARIGSKWLVVPSAQAQSMVKSSNLKTLLQGMFSTTFTSADEKTTTVTLTEVDGKPAYRMADTQDDTAMWLSTDADHHLIRIQGTSFGRLDFTDWNSAKTQTAPAASEVFHA